MKLQKYVCYIHICIDMYVTFIYALLEKHTIGATLGTLLQV